MNTLLAVQDMLVANSGFVVAQSSEGLTNAIRDFILPIAMLATGIAAISFLYQRKLTEFIIFAVIAVAVFAILVAPEILANLGSSFGRNNSNWG